jgi:hypothetical protein
VAQAPHTQPLADLLAEIPREQIATAITLLAARLLAETLPSSTNGYGADRMLTAAEAAQLLRRKTRWIYRNQHKLPFAKLGERGLIISERRLLEWIERQQQVR